MIRIVNWPSFQSYKDRKPPWIRLHKTLLDNYEFQSMSADARALLPMLWLLASEDDDPRSGLIKCETEKISFRLRIPQKTVDKAIAEMVDAGFVEQLQPCNETVTKPYPTCTDFVTPETETETETEKTLSSSKQLDGDSRPALSAKNGVPFSKIVEHLNAVAGTFYKPTTVNTKNRIKARWQEGNRLDDFLVVIDHKCEEWLGDEKMGKFLRPETLFGPKFESYLVSAKAAGVGVKPKLRWHK